MIRTGRWRSSAAAVIATLSVVSTCDGAVTEKGVVRQPRNIYELVYAFEHTFPKLLTPEELALYKKESPEAIRESHPDLYARISQDVVAWTDEWIAEMRKTEVPIAPKKLDEGSRIAAEVDGVLRDYFAARGWIYKPMRVVFLPPHLFLDERHRGDVTSGMFIPFYPGAFFATIDWPAPIELVLVHESLHFNATREAYGRPLLEGLTEAGAENIVLRKGLLTPGKVNRAGVYAQERKGVEFVVQEIMKRTNRSHEESLELLLESYLTGQQDKPVEVFGKDTWDKVVGLSMNDGDWQTHRLAEALGVKE